MIEFVCPECGVLTNHSSILLVERGSKIWCYKCGRCGKVSPQDRELLLPAKFEKAAAFFKAEYAKS